MNPTAVTPHFRFATIPGGSTEDNLKKNYPRMHRYMQKYNRSKVEDGIKALKSGYVNISSVSRVYMLFIFPPLCMVKRVLNNFQNNAQQHNHF